MAMIEFELFDNPGENSPPVFIDATKIQGFYCSDLKTNRVILFMHGINIHVKCEFDNLVEIMKNYHEIIGCC